MPARFDDPATTWDAPQATWASSAFARLDALLRDAPPTPTLMPEGAGLVRTLRGRLVATGVIRPASGPVGLVAGVPSAYLKENTQP